MNGIGIKAVAAAAEAAAGMSDDDWERAARAVENDACALEHDGLARVFGIPSREVQRLRAIAAKLRAHKR